jgi:fluoride exporter
MRLLTIAVGGAAGALCRYFVTGWVQGLATGPFPVGTLFVNFSGCFVFGALAAIFTWTAPASDPYRVLLLVGFLGAYTTFSTFSWDTLALFDDGRLDLALLNVGASNLLCLTGVWLGHRLAS